MSPSHRQAVNFSKCAFIQVGAVKVVHSKSSDKHESSQTLRVAWTKAGIDLRYPQCLDIEVSDLISVVHSASISCAHTSTTDRGCEYPHHSLQRYL